LFALFQKVFRFTSSKQAFIQKDYNVGPVNEPKDIGEKILDCGYDSSKDNDGGEEEIITDTIKDKLLLISDNENL
jgi:hypothetical protein